MAASRPVSLPIAGEIDIMKARQEVRLQAQALGFSLVDQIRIATAVSELARNIVAALEKSAAAVLEPMSVVKL